MNTPSSFPVETLWHTNWGFCVRTILAGQTTDFFLDHRISWPHRDYVESVIDGVRVEHENTSHKIGTPNQLIDGTVAHIKARIIATGDDIPLDPHEAISTVQRLWNARIERAKPEDRSWLEKYRDRLCAEIHSVLDGQISSVVAIDGVLWICSALKRPQW